MFKQKQHLSITIWFQTTVFHFSCPLISLAEDITEDITNMIRKNLDKGNIGSGIFVDLQNAFDTVEYNILLGRLEYYSICGMANNWFDFYLLDRNNLFQQMVIYPIKLQ